MLKNFQLKNIRVQKIAMMFSVFLLMSSISFMAFPFSHDYQFDHVFSQKLTQNIPNPLLKNPTSETESQFRFQSKLNHSFWRWILRPFFLSNLDSNDEVMRNKLDIKVAKLQIDLWENHFISLGKFNSQWGPAEFMSWSNPLFHFDPQSKSFLYEESGLHLIQYDFLPSSQFSTQFLYKYAPKSFENNDRDDFVLNAEFTQDWLLKFEYYSEDQSQFLGTTFSQTSPMNDWHLGYYGKYSINQIFSLYTDSRVSYMHDYYTLGEVSLLGTNVKTFENGFSNGEFDRYYRHFINVGLRIEDEYDYRIEYIYNQYGLNRNELKIARSDLMSPQNPLRAYNTAILGNRGSEFIGQSYLYHSYRISNKGFKDKMNFYIRHTFSLQDYTSNVQWSTEYPYSDQAVLFSELQTFLGPRFSEFNGTGRIQWTIGSIYNF